MKSLSAIPRQPRLGAAVKSSRPSLTVSPRPPAVAVVNATPSAVKHYDAARQDRLTGDFQISRLSGDAELQGRLPIIRSRSRHAERNEPLAENFLYLSENNIVGHAGFVFESKVVLSKSIDPVSGEEVIVYDAKINREIERAWNVFRQRENFLTTRNMDAVAAEKLIVRTIRRDGDCLIRKVRGYPNRFGFALQLLEPDFLDDQYIDFRGVACNCPNERTLPDGRPYPYCRRGLHQVRMGVELHGDWMFPVAYWILADHPGDYFFGNQFSVYRERVPVEDMIHPFVSKRMGQTRGVPALVAALLRLEMLGGYDEATLVKARAAAQKLGFLEKEIPDSVADQFVDKLGDPSGTMDSEPGGILDLPPGVTFKPWDPADPSPQYEPFTKQQTRMVGCAGGVSYTSLSNNIEAVNFSSIRAGLLEEREGWKGGQGHFVAEIERQVFEGWLPMAILSGECDVPMSRVDEFTQHDVAVFSGRTWPWVDPEKDVAASLAAIEGGISTRTDELAGRGKDFEKVTATLGREKKARDAAGILPPEPPAPDAPADPEKEDDDEKPDPDDVDGAVKRDGWVTIQGRPVHFGPDGKVDSGGGRQLVTARQAARSAYADKAGESAFAAGNAAHSAPSPASHTAAAGAHRAASLAHQDAAQSGPRATEHAGHALMHGEKADGHEKMAKDSAPKRPRRTFSLPFAPTGAMDAIDHIADQGGIASRRMAEKRGSLAGFKADYDDAPELRGIYHHAVFGGSMRPDQMASTLHELHGIGDGSVGGMYGAISDAITTRQSVQKETARQKEQHKQGERFDRDALVHHKGDKTVNVSNLSEGDVLSIHGEKVRVKKVDADTGEVTLQDHTKYGVQRVSDGQALYVEHVEQKDDGDAPFHQRRPGDPADAQARRRPDPDRSAGPGGSPDAPAPAVDTHGRREPVSAAVKIEATGTIGAAGSHALSAINRTHDSEGLQGTRLIEDTTARQHEDGYYRPQPGGIHEIGVSTHALHPELTTTHEVGHLVHHQVFAYADGQGSTAADAALKPYHEAVRKTESAKALARTARSHRAGSGEVSKHIRYLADSKETFARDYSHYVALRSGDAKLMEQVRRERANRYQFGHLAYRTDAEMETVAAGFDQVFHKKGWR